MSFKSNNTEFLNIYLDALIDPSFQGVNRLMIVKYEA